MTDDLPPILRQEHHDEPSVFRVDGLLRQARRQRHLGETPVPDVCLLDPDGDVVRHLARTGEAVRHDDWACHHSELWIVTCGDREIGIVPCVVGASSRAVLTRALVSGVLVTAACGSELRLLLARMTHKEHNMRPIIGVLVLVALVSAGCADRGKPGSTGPGGSVVEVTMRDNTYNPEMISVPGDRRVVLRFVNRGSVEHEAIIGDQAAQDDHASEMRSATAMSSEDMGGMGEMSHAPGDRAVTVKPGATAEIVTIFDSAGTLIIGCHQPGHYESGMKASLRVA